MQLTMQAILFCNAHGRTGFLSDSLPAKAGSHACCKLFVQCRMNRRFKSQYSQHRLLDKNRFEKFEHGLLESGIGWRRHVVATF
jgi:hypothetical protein